MLPGVTEAEFTALLLSVGKTTRDRRPLSPVEAGELCAKSVAAGSKADEIARACQLKDRSMVSKFLRVTGFAPEIRHLISWGNSGDGALGFSTAAELFKLPAGDHGKACTAALQHRLTRDEMRSVVQLVDRSGESLDDCIVRVVRRRPVVRVRQIVLGAITEDLTQQALKEMTQLERDDFLGAVIKYVFPSASDFTAKLGVERFTIIGGKSIASTVAAEPQMERLINTALKERLS
jgi:hypothetical protein